MEEGLGFWKRGVAFGEGAWLREEGRGGLWGRGMAYRRGARLVEEGLGLWRRG